MVHTLHTIHTYIHTCATSSYLEPQAIASGESKSLGQVDSSADLKCARRNDLDETQGSLPDHSIYIGSSSGISHRLCYHFTPNCGSQFTKQFPPASVIGLDMRRPNDVRQCLRWEDEIVIERMKEYMETYTHPQAWRAVAGGSWSKPHNRKMPEPLRHWLHRTRVLLRPSADADVPSLARQQSIQT